MGELAWGGGGGGGGLVSVPNPAWIAYSITHGEGESGDVSILDR